jgi:hypothetical protein
MGKQKHNGLDQNFGIVSLKETERCVGLIALCIQYQIKYENIDSFL